MVTRDRIQQVLQALLQERDGRSCADDIEKSFCPPAINAIKLSGRTFLAPHRGSSPKGRGGYVAVLHESVEISIASDYST